MRTPVWALCLNLAQGFEACPVGVGYSRPKMVRAWTWSESGSCFLMSPFEASFNSISETSTLDRIEEKALVEIPVEMSTYT